MDDDVITEDDFWRYMRVRVRNIAAKHGGKPALDTQQQTRTEFACDLFGAAMYASQKGDYTIYDRIGVSYPETRTLVNNDIHNALAYDPEIEHDAESTILVVLFWTISRTSRATP